MIGIHIIGIRAAQSFADLPPVSQEEFLRMILLVIKIESCVMFLGLLVAIGGYFSGRRKFSWCPTESRLTRVEVDASEEFDREVQVNKPIWKVRAVLHYVYSVENRSYTLSEFAKDSNYKQKPSADELREEQAKQERFYRQQNEGTKAVYYDPKAPAKAEFRTSPMTHLELRKNFLATMSGAWTLSIVLLVYMGMIIVLRLLRCDYDPSLSSPV